MAIGRSATGGVTRRRFFGVRFYLVLAFAAVALITAGLAFTLVSGSSEGGANERAAELAVGRAVRLADRIGDTHRSEWDTVLMTVEDPGFSAWIVDRDRRRITPRRAHGVVLRDVPGHRTALTAALRG